MTRPTATVPGWYTASCRASRISPWTPKQVCEGQSSQRCWVRSLIVCDCDLGQTQLPFSRTLQTAHSPGSWSHTRGEDSKLARGAKGSVAQTVRWACSPGPQSCLHGRASSPAFKNPKITVILWFYPFPRSEVFHNLQLSGRWHVSPGSL